MPQHPTPLRKLQQLWRLVRESHENPIAGAPAKPAPIADGATAVTFIGHSSFLIRTAGLSVLIDPVFATRLILLRRQRHPGILVRDLPPIDAILITHAHMDHLNFPSLRAVLREMRRRKLPTPIAIVPNGVEDLVSKLGFGLKFKEVRSLSWWQSTELHPQNWRLENSRLATESQDTPGLTITATPAKHWGARLFSDTHRGFGGYTLAAPGAPTLYHSGDTAYFPGFHEIGRRLQPEIALLPIGAYFPDSYRAVHTSPEEALQAFLDLRAQHMIPMHYNTFRLGREPMSEPLPRLLDAAKKAGVRNRIIALEEGESWLAPVAHRELAHA